MKHLTEREQIIHILLRQSRTLVVVGASPRAARHSNAVVGYLRRAGYEVIPVRPDRAEVLGLPSYATLADVPRGAIDLVVLFRRPDAIAGHLHEAAARRPRAVWLQPGLWTPRADQVAAALGLQLVKDECIEEAHRHASRRSGHSEFTRASHAR